MSLVAVRETTRRTRDTDAPQSGVKSGPLTPTTAPGLGGSVLGPVSFTPGKDLDRVSTSTPPDRDGETSPLTSHSPPCFRGSYSSYMDTGDGTPTLPVPVPRPGIGIGVRCTVRPKPPTSPCSPGGVLTRETVRHGSPVSSSEPTTLVPARRNIFQFWFTCQSLSRYVRPAHGSPSRLTEVETTDPHPRVHRGRVGARGVRHVGNVLPLSSGYTRSPVRVTEMTTIVITITL